MILQFARCFKDHFLSDNFKFVAWVSYINLWSFYQTSGVKKEVFNCYGQISSGLKGRLSKCPIFISSHSTWSVQNSEINTHFCSHICLLVFGSQKTSVRSFLRSFHTNVYRMTDPKWPLNGLRLCAGIQSTINIYLCIKLAVQLTDQCIQYNRTFYIE